MKKRHRALVRLLAGAIPLAVASVCAHPAAAQGDDEPQKAPPAETESSDPPAAASSSDPARAATPTHPWRTGGIVMSVVGGAGVVTAAVLAVDYIVQAVNDFRSSTFICLDTCPPRRQPDEGLLIGAIVSELLGGGLLAGGIVLATRRGPPAKPDVSWVRPSIAIDKDRVQLGLRVAW